MWKIEPYFYLDKSGIQFLIRSYEVMNITKSNCQLTAVVGTLDLRLFVIGASNCEFMRFTTMWNWTICISVFKIRAVFLLVFIESVNLSFGKFIIYYKIMFLIWVEYLMSKMVTSKV